MVNSKKVCPLLMAANTVDYCQEADCAWWDIRNEACAILSLGNWASWLALEAARRGDKP